MIMVTETVPVTQAAFDCFDAASNANAEWMGDPDGNDDTSAGRQAAAAVIARHRLAAQEPAPTPEQHADG